MAGLRSRPAGSLLWAQRRAEFTARSARSSFFDSQLGSIPPKYHKIPIKTSPWTIFWPGLGTAVSHPNPSNPKPLLHCARTPTVGLCATCHEATAGSVAWRSKSRACSGSWTSFRQWCDGCCCTSYCCHFVIFWNTVSLYIPLDL